MTNTAQCLQVSMQIHTTHIAFFKEIKCSTMPKMKCAPNNVFKQICCRGGINESQGFHYSNRLTAMN